MQRRALFALMPAALFAACGFELRRPPELQLKRVMLKGFEKRSPLADELSRTLVAGGTQVVEA